jgi:3'-5' exoribonuclease
MILSHHGSDEFGSPKLPMTLEAIALAHIDDLDAKLHNFDQLMRDDPNVDSAWTPFQANLSRKLYKGPPANPTAATDDEE